MTFLPFTRPTLDEETIQGVVEVLRSGWLATGPKVEIFEQALSSYLGGKRIVKVFTSATAALEVALQTMGIGTGDEVITTAMSFAATTNVILRVGATPVFVDVELDSRNIDLNLVEKAISKKTKAIIPVHFAGLPINLDELYALAEKHNLRVIEDAAHAIGSSWKGDKIGSRGDMIVFSFHPNKNITSIEGGAISLRDSHEAKLIDLHRFHGIQKNTEGLIDVHLPGGKFNMPDVCARVGLGQLPYLDEFCQKRRELAHHYLDILKDFSKFHLPIPGDEGHSWHIFCPLLKLENIAISRNDFIKKMHENHIGVGIHYPAITEFTYYKQYLSTIQTNNHFPNAVCIGSQTVTLPLFPLMEKKDVETVCAVAKNILR